LFLMVRHGGGVVSGEVGGEGGVGSERGARAWKFGNGRLLSSESSDCCGESDSSEVTGSW